MQIAHISDIHVRWPKGAGGPWYRYFNKRILGWLNLLLHRSHSEAILEAALEDLRRDPPDHLMVTGDLTNLSLESEFERARGYLEQAGLPREQVSVIPGNHDTYTRESYTARRFEHVLAPFLDEQVAWPRVQRREGLTIVSTTSAVPTPWFTAFGRMGDEQLEKIGAALGEAPGDTLKVLLVHHPPLLGDGQPDKRRRNNRDGDRLLAVCREGGARLLLCGHTHRAFSYEADGVWVFCAGSTTQVRKEAGPSYNRYTVEDGALKAVEVRQYDPARKAFVSLERRDLT